MAFDFDAAVGAPFRMQPGLRRLAPAALQLTPAAPGLPHMREKLAVLSTFASQALCSVPGCDAQAAIAATLALAATEHPGTMQWDGEVASALGVRCAPPTVRWRSGPAAVSAPATRSHGACVRCPRPGA